MQYCRAMKKNVTHKIQTLLAEFEKAVTTLDTKQDFESAGLVCLVSRELGGEFIQGAAWSAKEIDFPAYHEALLPIYKRATESLSAAMPFIEEPIVDKYLKSVQAYKDRISKVDSFASLIELPGPSA